MHRANVERVATLGRWILLLTVAGSLILRRDFAHRNLGELFSLLGLQSPALLKYASVTEVVLVLLLPFVLKAIWDRLRHAEVFQANLRPGPAVWIALAFCLWGAAHAVYAWRTGGDKYLIIRQTAMAAYPLFFIYTFLFFITDYAMEHAAVFGVAVAGITAGLDYLGFLGPPYFAESAYGQMTLPLGILGLGLYIVSVKSWPRRMIALAALGFIGWRQSQRFQSVVPLSMAGALGLYLLFGLVQCCFKQFQTLKRAVLLLALFGVLFGAYSLRKLNQTDRKEVGAWKFSRYSELMALYHKTDAPSDPWDYQLGWRPPQEPMEDPEFYKLQAVFLATGDDISVRNNIWRLLVWRRMLLDWREKHTVLGAGVGKPWFYPMLYHTGFNYGTDAEGLDPHNSQLHVLYRYGIVGFALLVLAVATVLLSAARALSWDGGDPLLEGLVLYFGYALTFTLFVVALESPPYALPFWFAAGLVYARARRLNVLLSDPARKITP